MVEQPSPSELSAAVEQLLLSKLSSWLQPRRSFQDEMHKSVRIVSTFATMSCEKRTDRPSAWSRSFMTARASFSDGDRFRDGPAGLSASYLHCALLSLSFRRCFLVGLHGLSGSVLLAFIGADGDKDNPDRATVEERPLTGLRSFLVPPPALATADATAAAVRAATIAASSPATRERGAEGDRRVDGAVRRRLHEAPLPLVARCEGVEPPPQPGPAPKSCSVRLTAAFVPMLTLPPPPRGREAAAGVAPRGV